jgi:hypothetical protein
LRRRSKEFGKTFRTTDQQENRDTSLTRQIERSIAHVVSTTQSQKRMKLLFLFLFSLISSSITLSNHPSHTHSAYPTLIRNYSQISRQCRDFISFSDKKLFFFDARRELNLSTPSSLDDSLYCPHGGDFLNSTYGGLTFPLNHSLVTYGRVFKANSENIVYSFLQASNLNLSSNHFNDINQAIGSPYFSSLLQKSRRKDRLLYESMKVFSFFRHPISHFLSGLTESYFRSECRIHDTDVSNAMVHQCLLRKQNSSLVTEKLGIKILNTILSCEKGEIKKYLLTVQHFAPQSTTLHEWKPHFIGYLESFGAHWEELQVYINRQVPYLAQYQHITESDPFHINAVVSRILRQRPPFARAICRLLMSDFLCLKHSLPKECEDMIDQDGNYVPFASSN